MYHPIVLSEMANLHCREIKEEMVSWRAANHVYSQKNTRPRPRKRFLSLSFVCDHIGISARVGEAFSR